MSSARRDVATGSAADVVICGAGIAGLATAWQLACRHHLGRVVIVDERPPLTLTSDKSTECYRNWWPDAAMVELTNRSIALLEEIAACSGNAIALNRNGYLYLTATTAGADALAAAAEDIAALGAGPLRRHGSPARSTTTARAASAQPWVSPNWDQPPPTGPRDVHGHGADLFLEPTAIRRHFPWAPADTRAALHARRCGWFSAQQLGMWWLEQARNAGAELVRARLVAVETTAGRVASVVVRGTDGEEQTIHTSQLVIAAGPAVGEMARLVGVELPIFHELHRKVFFDDHLGVVPRELPLVIWQDPIRLDWSEEERAALAADPATAPLLGELPAGVHFRPEGGRGSRAVILLWNQHCPPVAPREPLPEDPLHVPLVIRGVARALPAFAAYRDSGRRPWADGGYYTKTRENRPLIGPLGVDGAWLIGALSGFGVMTAAAAGELLADHLVGKPVPPWSRTFLLDRYRDPAYLASIDRAAAGQL